MGSAHGPALMKALIDFFMMNARKQFLRFTAIGNLVGEREVVRCNKGRDITNTL